MNATENNMTVTETQGYERIDRGSGSLDIYRTFSVQRQGREAHRVTVRVSGDSGAPQSERCDCRGYQFRGECAHIHAVYAAGVLTCYSE